MGQPRLAFMIITAGNYNSCRRTINYIKKQSVVDQLELIIVGPSREEMQIDENDLKPFHNVQIIEFGPIISTGHHMARAVEAANAPYVAYAEEHDFLAPNLAETIIDLMDEGNYAAVGWSIVNANPGWVSWSHLYGQFGPAVHPVRSREMKSIVGHHAAYNREYLLVYGDYLPVLLNNEIMLHRDLYRRGHKLFLTGETYSQHVNISQFRTYLMLDYIGQRGTAATRAQIFNWSWAKKLLYIAGSPLIPFVRLRRSLRDIRRTGRASSLLPQIAFIIFAANLFGAVGEVLGYIWGMPDNLYDKRIPIELDRFSYVADQDKYLADS